MIFLLRPIHLIAIIAATAVLIGLPKHSFGLSSEPRDYAVEVKAQVTESPLGITLDWRPIATPTLSASYEVSRRAGAGWGTPINVGTATSWSEDPANLQIGGTYEYRVTAALDGEDEGSGADFYAFGYINVGIRAPLVNDGTGTGQHNHRGTVILIVDNRFSMTLAPEIARLVKDFIGDGWRVIKHDVSANDEPRTIKNLIRADYLANPDVKAVCLLGHIPVVYSGEMVPDGHPPEHLGAWPADAYYGEMDLSDAQWGDCLRNVQASYYRNKNVPGDGKFDSNAVPSAIELQVGRIDLHDMPVIGLSENDALKRYLDKNHNFRHKLFAATRRALIASAFDALGGEAPAASGYRAFAPLINYNNVVFAEATPTTPDANRWITKLKAGYSTTATPYLWAFGAGGGDWTQVAGLGTHLADGVRYVWSSDMVTAANNDTKAVFFILFGSWFGDWDNTDNFMRAVLGNPRYGLASCWSGRPHLFFHHMTLGQTIGNSIRISQNNDGITYSNWVNDFPMYAHVALMGDPTLRMHVIDPPGFVSASYDAGTGMDTIVWSKSTDLSDTDASAGYHVYHSVAPNGPFTRLTANKRPATATSHSVAPVGGKRRYLVRAVRLETTPSGTYTNISQAAFFDPVGVLGIVSVTNRHFYGREPMHGLVENCVVTLVRSDTSTAIDVNYSLSGTADSSDYTVSIASPVHFNIGEQTKNVTITIANDSNYEDNETVALTLQGGPNYRVSQTSNAVVTINSLATLLPLAEDLDDLASVRALGNSGLSAGLSTLAPYNSAVYRTVKWTIPARVNGWSRSWLNVRPDTGFALTVPSDFFSSYATAVAESGSESQRIVGLGWRTSTEQNAAFHSEGYWSDYLLPFANNVSTAYAANNGVPRRAVGMAETASWSVHASVWDLEGDTPLLRDLGVPVGESDSWALGINDLSDPHVVGHSEGPSGTLPLVWRGLGSTVSVLPIPSGHNQGTARDVNDAGVIVGWVWNTSTGENVAGKWSYNGAAYQWVPLHNPDNIATYAQRLNSAGDTVGYSYDVVYGFRAVLWNATGLQYLNTFRASGSPLWFYAAYDINDDGEIAGEVIDSSCASKGFLLSP
jgi:hypothetical protein